MVLINSKIMLSIIHGKYVTSGVDCSCMRVTLSMSQGDMITNISEFYMGNWIFKELKTDIPMHCAPHNCDGPYIKLSLLKACMGQCIGISVLRSKTHLPSK